MSGERSLLRTLGNLAILGVLVLAAVLGVLVVISRSQKEDAEGEGAGNGEEEAGGTARGLHPEGEMLVLKFREMFDYDAAAAVNDGRGSAGITPIVTNRGRGKTIDERPLLELAGKLHRNVAYLADGTTQVEQAVGWFVHDGRVHFIVLLRPYERVAHEMMKRPGEDLFVSFLGADGQRVAPRSAPERIATSDLRVAVAVAGEKRIPAGWVCYGELPLQEAVASDLKEPKVGWIFSDGLHERLRKLRWQDIVRAEGEVDPFRAE